MSELVEHSPAQSLRTMSAVGSRSALTPYIEMASSFFAHPALKRALPAILMLGMVGIAALIWAAFSQPPQRSLFNGLADVDKAAVSTALETGGIAYSLESNGGTLTVSETDYYRARMLLAAQGLPKSAPDGDAILTALPMGASRILEGERVKGAHEIDLARTIEEMDSIETARVHLAVEAPSLFVRDQAPARASVMLKLHAGRSLGESQTRAIAYLVSSAVPGLSVDQVSIVDQSGRLLSHSSTDGGTQASDKQLDIQSATESRYMAGLNKLLLPLVGEGNFTAEVHADLNFEETQATRETYPKDLASVRAEQGGWTRDGGPDSAGGIPGALSNQAPPASQVAAAPGDVITPVLPGANSSAASAARTSENYNRTFELGREVSVTRQPVGQVSRLSVAVALRDLPGSKPRSNTELTAIEQLVRGAIGFDQARGDVVAISSRPFAKVDEVRGSWWQEPWVALVGRNVSALLISALVIFGIGRPLLAARKSAAAMNKVETVARRSVIGGEIASAIAREAKDNPESAVTLDMIESAPGYAARAALIRNFVQQDPSRAALVVRDLIKENAGKAHNG
jgi:flagellar M-ring protein FliF